MQRHRLAGQPRQHVLDPVRVLGSDPVELEAVGHAQRNHRAAPPSTADVGGRQRADPGVELLFGQFGGQLFAAALRADDLIAKFMIRNSSNTTQKHKYPAMSVVPPCRSRPFVIKKCAN